MGRGIENNLCVGLSYTTAQPGSTFGKEQPPTYFQCTFSPCIQLTDCGDPSPVAHVLCHHPLVWAMAGAGFAAFGLHLQWLHQYSSLCKHKLPCCLELLQIIHIDSALLMIKYDVLQSVHLTGKLDWIYRFEVGWVVFSYIARLFFFFLPCGTSCHFANEELPSCLLIKPSISEGFTSSCLIKQLIYCMPHHHLRGPLPHSHHKQSSSCRSIRLSRLCPETTGWRTGDRTGPSEGRRLQITYLWMASLGLPRIGRITVTELVLVLERTSCLYRGSQKRKCSTR